MRKTSDREVIRKMGWRDQVAALAEELAGARHAIALTGAGISVASGIPPFRGQGGLWERYDPEEYAHIDAFRRNPHRVWEMLGELHQVLARARPNPAHVALARLERLGILRCVITQNIDGLHQAAGQRDVVEFHGNHRHLVCLSCGRRYDVAYVDEVGVPPRCFCGAVLKPDAVFFGEPIPPHALLRAHAEAQAADWCLVVGTSGLVEPAASIPGVARRFGARIVEVNPVASIEADYSLLGPAEEVLAVLAEATEAAVARRRAV